MFINKKIALAGALALVFAGSAQAAELSCANPSVVINTITPTSDWSGGADMAPDGYGFNTGGAPLNIYARFDISNTLTAAQLATIKVAFNGTAFHKLTNIASYGVTFGLPALPITGPVSIAPMTTSGFSPGLNTLIQLTLAPQNATTDAKYQGTITITVDCSAAATVSAVPASNPWTLAALGGVLAIAGGGAAAARRRKAQNPSA